MQTLPAKSTQLPIFKNTKDMSQQEAIKLFDSKRIRTVWDEDQEKWFFSIVDVIAVLTESENPRKYWSVLKTRLKNEGSEMATNCNQLKLQAAPRIRKRWRKINNALKKVEMWHAWHAKSWRLKQVEM